MGISRSRDLWTGGLRHLGWLGDVMAEAAVDTGESVGQQWTILHIHMQGQGRQDWDWRDVSHPSMGLGWHAQIGASLSTKGPRGSGVI